MLGLAVLWLVIWFIAIWVIPYSVIALGFLIGAEADEPWGAMVAFLSLILALAGWGFAIFQFIMQIIAVVQLAT